MRIEVNDEAARLRRTVHPIECAGEQDDDAAPTADQEPCRDCGEQMFACRCSPGEG